MLGYCIIIATGNNGVVESRLDVNYGVKQYKDDSEDGSIWEKVITWFSYRLHLLVDKSYELSVAFSMTPASHSEMKEAHLLIDTLRENRPQR